MSEVNVVDDVLKRNLYDQPIHYASLCYLARLQARRADRRNSSIRGKISDFSWTLKPNLMVLKPEIQLLYKSRSKRPKDLQDLGNCLQKFDSNQKDILRNWIITDSGQEHPWVELI